MSRRKYEVHVHGYVRGPSAARIEHSHEGGTEPHKHPETGPAQFTIDKDAWLAATGLKGGGRKRFTSKPTGPQFDRVELEDWQRTFRIVVGPRPVNQSGEGGGLATAVRMVLGHGMRPLS